MILVLLRAKLIHKLELRRSKLYFLYSKDKKGLRSSGFEMRPCLQEKSQT
jgi:hypothetical protein